MIRKRPPYLPPRHQLRKNTKRETQTQIERKPSFWPSFDVWIKRLFFVVGSVIGAMLLAGTENVKQIPEIPKTAYQTAMQVWFNWKRDKNLTGVWEGSVVVTGKDKRKTDTRIRLELQTKDGSASGQITSPAILQLGARHQTAMVIGDVKDGKLELTAFDFLGDTRATEFAIFTVPVGFQRAPGITITEDPFAFDFSYMNLTTKWQRETVLPKTIELTSNKEGP